MTVFNSVMDFRALKNHYSQDYQKLFFILSEEIKTTRKQNEAAEAGIALEETFPE